ncbi:hypothetical protein DWX05_02070 [Coprobacillus sp. AF18-15LB]|nr:hypothetical protein DWX19_01500 [Coprobacillus sp. AF18-40]RGT87300.1 hypothetical protein DWX05_02070 [Coprobacillus sp. AF18-15LB]
MNKYKKALKDVANETVDGYYQPKTVEHFHSEDIGILRELVERATPKKPIKNKMGKISFLDKLFGTEATYTCPNCRNALLKHYMNERQETRYCWDCGQTLDWKGEDEE